jgi:hypothetical protein
MGAEQTKLIGSHRVHVPCDDDVAINAGKTLYGEPKFKTQFIPASPVLNGPPNARWAFVCCDPDHPPAGDDQDARAHAIYTCETHVEGLSIEISNPSPITVYGTVTAEGPDHGKPIGARWNILQPFSTYKLAPGDGRVQLGYGRSEHPMQADVKHMLGTADASIIRTSISPPSAIQSRAYWT